MSAELWGSRVELKWVMNRAIFQGIAAAEARRAVAKCAGEAHGEGTQGGTWAVTRVAAFLHSQFCAERKALCCLPGQLLPSACCYLIPQDHWCPQSGKQPLPPHHHAHVPGNFWQRPYWAGSTTAPFSKKRIFLKGIGRETSLGIASFPQPVTPAVMHTLIWEEV